VNFLSELLPPLDYHRDWKDSHKPAMDAKQDPYTWEGATGWRQYRMLRPGRGMYYDVKRRLPYYWSDIRDAFNYRTFAATVRMYFVKYVQTSTIVLEDKEN
jgi:hypothetical protein